MGVVPIFKALRVERRAECPSVLICAGVPCWRVSRPRSMEREVGSPRTFHFTTQMLSCTLRLSRNSRNMEIASKKSIRKLPRSCALTAPARGRVPQV